MLSYRSIFAIQTPDAYRRIVEPELFRWLSERKDLDLDRLGSAWTVGKNARASLVTVPGKSGSGHRRRLRMVEGSGYSTTITTDERGDDDLTFWIDVETPDAAKPAKVPALVRDIIEETTAFDGASQLTDTPHVLTLADMPDLARAINDDQRRGIIFAAGTAQDIPTEAWRNYVRTITRDTVGMATVVVLDTALTETFQHKFGPAPSGYAVPPGTVRSFLPGARLDDASDARRNKILGTNRLLDDSNQYLLRVLGGVARRAAIAQPLRKDERDLDRVLNKTQVDELLGLEVPAPTESPGAVAPKSPSPRKQPIVRAREAIRVRTSRRPAQPAATSPARSTSVLQAVADACVRVLTESWGLKKVTLAEIPLIESALAEHPASRKVRAEQVSARLSEVELECDIALEQLQEIRSVAEDLDLEVAELREEKSEKDATINGLRVKLSAADQAAAAWEPEPKDPRRTFPTSFSELLRRDSDLANLVFTCNEDDVAALDEAVGSTARVAETWEGLIALDDYARAKVATGFTGSLYEYLSRPPTGYSAIPLARFSPDESETVNNRSKYRDQRLFDVPLEFDPTGKALMMSHLKIGKSTTDPRVHFVDLTAKHGKVVVGYIGRHLTVKSTN